MPDMTYQRPVQWGRPQTYPRSKYHQRPPRLRTMLYYPTGECECKVCESEWEGGCRCLAAKGRCDCCREGNHRTGCSEPEDCE